MTSMATMCLDGGCRMGASKNHHNAMMTAAYRIIVESDVFQNLTPVLQERIKGYLEPPEEYLPSWREFSFQWHDLNLEVKLTLGITTLSLTVEPDGLPMTLMLTHSFECVSYRQTLQQFSDSAPIIQKMSELGLAFNKIEPIRALAMTRDEITAEEKRAEIVKSHTAVQNIIREQFHLLGGQRVGAKSARKIGWMPTANYESILPIDHQIVVKNKEFLVRKSISESGDFMSLEVIRTK